MITCHDDLVVGHAPFTPHFLCADPRAARRCAATPEQMAGFAAVIGCAAVAGELAAAVAWDTPAGPSIVATATLIFFATLLGEGGRRGI